MIFDFLDEPGGGEICDHLGARLEPVETPISRRRRVVQPSVPVKNIELRQAVPLADLEIGKIVGRRDLDCAAAGLGVGVLVRDDRNEPVGERQAHRFSDEVGETRIARMYGDTGIAQHGLRPGRCDGNEPPGILCERVADVPQRTLGFAALNLEIRDHGVHHRVPVDEPLVAVNETLAIKLDKDSPYRGRETRVHREPLAAPIRRSAEATQLIDDGAARLLLPFPHAGDEAFSPDIVLAPVFLDELIGDDDLRGDPGVIGARLPQHVATPHALIADQHILQGKGQRVTHVQDPRHIRGRHHDCVRRFAAVEVGGEATRPLP